MTAFEIVLAGVFAVHLLALAGLMVACTEPSGRLFELSARIRGAARRAWRELQIQIMTFAALAPAPMRLGQHRLVQP